MSIPDKPILHLSAEFRAWPPVFWPDLNLIQATARRRWVSEPAPALLFRHLRLQPSRRLFRSEAVFALSLTENRSIPQLMSVQSPLPAPNRPLINSWLSAAMLIVCPGACRKRAERSMKVIVFRFQRRRFRRRLF